VHPAIAVAFADLAGDPPDCVLLGDAPSTVQLWGLESGSSSSFSQGLPAADRHRPENRIFREGGELLLDAERLSLQTIEWAPVFRRWCLETVGCLLCELVASTNFSASLPDGGRTIWRRM